MIFPLLTLGFLIATVVFGNPVFLLLAFVASAMTVSQVRWLLGRDYGGMERWLQGARSL